MPGSAAMARTATRMADVIDLFAGLGGFSEGAEQAGHRVVWAGNHCPAAVAVHSANHPGAAHVCQDLHQADWSEVPRHDILLASPACQGHTRARGKERPHHDTTRSTAWAVVSALECHRTPLAVVENVIEFARWTLFRAWCSALRDLGYAVAPHIVDSADHGVPQNRVRLLIAVTRSKHPIELQLPKKAHVPASSFIDFSLGRWAPIDRAGRSPATLARIAAGRQQHGVRFLTAYYGNERGGRSLTRPIGTITTRDRWAVIDGDRMRMVSVPEAKAAMGFRADYRLPDRQKDAMHMLGNAVSPPVVRDFLSVLEQAA